MMPPPLRLTPDDVVLGSEAETLAELIQISKLKAFLPKRSGLPALSDRILSPDSIHLRAILGFGLV